MLISSPNKTIAPTKRCERMRQTGQTALTVSVIICTYNRQGYLKEAIGSLDGQTWAGGFEIIVVDNACSSELAEHVGSLKRDDGVRIRYIAEQRVGLHHARHSGAIAAKGEILIYLDDDVLVPSGWLEAMLKPYEDERIGCVGGKTLLRFEKTPPSWLSESWRAYLSEWDRGEQQQTLGKNESPVGCNFSVRKKVLFEVGGFNPDAFGDGKLIWRRGDGECGLAEKNKAAGYKVIYEPSAWLWHRVPVNRMSVEYLERRMFIEGITSNYRCYREQPRSSLRLACETGYQGACWLYHRLRESVAGLMGRQALSSRLAGAFRWGRLGHSVRLVFSSKLRQHVLRRSYLEAGDIRNTRPTEKIIVVFPPPYMDSSPGMGSLVERLADEGSEVYVLMGSSVGYGRPSFANERVHLMPVRARSERKVPARFFPLSVLLAGRALRLARRIRPTWVIGALPTGLLGAMTAAWASGAKGIYFSLELYPSAESKGLSSRVLKLLEKWANRAAEYTIIQDMYRGRQLIDDHKLEARTVLELPNSRGGQAANGQSDYLQRRFRIAGGDRVVLYAGGIAEWSESADLVESALNWPSDWHLVLHSPQIRANDPYIAGLQKKSNNGKVLFSLEPLAQAQMDELTSSADIGLALYKGGFGLNNNLIGHSAGKICQYLRCGLPVVVSDLPSLRAWIENYQCGICVQGPGQVQGAIEKIFAKYGQYQRNARRCFKELLGPERYLDTIIERLKQSAP